MQVGGKLGGPQNMDENERGTTPEWHLPMLQYGEIL